MAILMYVDIIIGVLIQANSVLRHIVQAESLESVFLLHYYYLNIVNCFSKMCVSINYSQGNSDLSDLNYDDDYNNVGPTSVPQTAITAYTIQKTALPRVSSVSEPAVLKSALTKSLKIPFTAKDSLHSIVVRLRASNVEQMRMQPVYFCDDV